MLPETVTDEAVPACRTSPDPSQPSIPTHAPSRYVPSFQPDPFHAEGGGATSGTIHDPETAVNASACGRMTYAPLQLELVSKDTSGALR